MRKKNTPKVAEVQIEEIKQKDPQNLAEGEKVVRLDEVKQAEQQ